MEILKNLHQTKINTGEVEYLLSRRLKNTSAAIIAGGKSSRFGTNKAKANYQNKEFIDIASQLGCRISSEVFIITGERYHYDDLLVPTFSDIVPNCGPIGGIFTALINSTNSFVCTLPCDMPLLVKEIFELLYEKRSENCPVVACSENGIEPLLSLWPTNMASVIYSHINNGEFRMRHLLSELNAIELNIPKLMVNYDPKIFTNINYKKDLEKIVNFQ